MDNLIKFLGFYTGSKENITQLGYRLGVLLIGLGVFEYLIIFNVLKDGLLVWSIVGALCFPIGFRIGRLTKKYKEL